jgi:hypothetical protein
VGSFYCYLLAFFGEEGDKFRFEIDRIVRNRRAFLSQPISTILRSSWSAFRRILSEFFKNAPWRVFIRIIVRSTTRDTRDQPDERSLTLRSVLITPRTKKNEIAAKVLLLGSDFLTTTGIALMLAGIAQISSLTFYHLHIVYDTASFVM